MAVGNRRQIAQRAVEAHVVVPEHIAVEGVIQLLQRAEGAASHELRLEYAVGCLGHRVVVGAALAPAAERPLDLPRTVAVPAAAEDPYDFVLQLRVAFFLLLRVIACVPADLKQ